VSIVAKNARLHELLADELRKFSSNGTHDKYPLTFLLSFAFLFSLVQEVWWKVPERIPRFSGLEESIKLASYPYPRDFHVLFRAYQVIKRGSWRKYPLQANGRDDHFNFIFL